MSKIIKGERVKIFKFFMPESQEESFNSFAELLPEEAWEEIEKTRKEQREKEEVEGPPLANEAEAKPAGEDLLEEPEQDPEPFDISQLSLEELLKHPEISKKIAHLEQEAYEKGFAQGQKDGAALGKKQYETLTHRLSALLSSIEREIEGHVLALEPQLFLMVKTIVSEIIRHEVSLNPEVIKTSLREALSHVVDQTRVKIHLNPDDMEFIEDIMFSVKEEFSRLKDFEIVPDTNVGRGGCILETDFGLIDATLERRFREVFARLSDEGTRS
ncbi:FliH/SctL family protein [Thermodesulfatator autotrophicus]|uniref:Flagellar assembly protein FliH n=1 Tax=Thermodesulfatator autotrophicus TaxID=1795632 RepID=A0A177E8D4_9BACT|nr:FliH/SctL family protein [Thermodesulfatator autotrophicus]OAG28165.1 hypothetical protein TH606_03225 [Thermodesulfatator autotrophicus]